MEERLMQAMVALRALSACVEVTAVVIMLRLTRVQDLLRLNAALGLVGPAIFLLVSALGLTALASHFSPLRFALVALGVLLVVIGTR